MHASSFFCNRVNAQKLINFLRFTLQIANLLSFIPCSHYRSEHSIAEPAFAGRQAHHSLLTCKKNEAKNHQTSAKRVINVVAEYHHLPRSLHFGPTYPYLTAGRRQAGPPLPLNLLCPPGSKGAVRTGTSKKVNVVMTWRPSVVFVIGI